MSAGLATILGSIWLSDKVDKPVLPLQRAKSYPQSIAPRRAGLRFQNREGENASSNLANPLAGAKW
jgi:hypothetical protein